METKFNSITSTEHTLNKGRTHYGDEVGRPKIRLLRSMTLIMLSVGAIVLSSCAAGPLFYADFDTDAAGSPPNFSPPGQPTGDLIYISDPNNTPGQLTVVNSAALASKSLQYSNIDIPVYARFVGFISTEESLAADQKFRARWDGRLDLANDGSALDIWLGNSHFVALAALRFKNGQVSVRTSNTPTYENIGTYSEESNHIVYITIDKQSQQYSIVMVPGGVASGWRPVLNPGALNTDRPTLYFQYSEEKSSPAKYVVDKVKIEKID